MKVLVAMTTVFLTLVALVGASVWLKSRHRRAFSHCQIVKPQQRVDVDKILGSWHVVQLVDNNLNARDQNNFCLEAELQRVNDTLLREFWVIQGRDINFQLDVHIIKPGVWEVSDSLGDPLQAVVLAAVPDSHLVLTYCSQTEGELVHEWSSVLARKKRLPPTRLSDINKLLEKMGLDVTKARVYDWEHCY